MENSNSVNLYVYTSVEIDGKETYSFPFSAIDDDSAVRLIAHNLAYAKFFKRASYSLGHVYQIGSADYVSSFTVSVPCVSDIRLLIHHDEVHFDRDVYQRDFDYYFSFLTKVDNKNSEDTPNA